MRRWKRWIDTLSREQAGSASLEFISAGVLLLVPLVYLVLALGALQAGSFAVEGAARQAARVFVEAGDQASAESRAQQAVQFALADHGLESAGSMVTVVCSPDPSRCLTRSGTVTVLVSVTVPMPFVPQALSVAAPLAVPMEASATQQVSRFAQVP
ncbi:hypothetical protein [Homoserinimonas hongtaonis]|uniref:hypothetical protein n=1 Tax=Homoserinimonas hongtaonis TaxID=2079791 RepID=UPI000D346CE7|nr:hypothetical protein [Salinibacterium hongtaonis]AWB88761.1 hypothetical protein C2138_03640 [Salinibacterium hongtaonis]